MHRRSPALWGGWSSYITVGAAIVCWKTSMQASLLHKPVRIILSHRGAFTTQCPCYCASLFLSRSWERKPNERVVQCSSESVNFAITVNPIKTDLSAWPKPPTHLTVTHLTATSPVRCPVWLSRGRRLSWRCSQQPSRSPQGVWTTVASRDGIRQLWAMTHHLNARWTLLDTEESPGVRLSLLNTQRWPHRDGESLTLSLC